MRLALLIFVLSEMGIPYGQAQPIRPDGSRHSNVRTAVPFLLISPDAQAGAMGECGVAGAANAYAMHWNAAKYAFASDDYGIGFAFTPWLKQLADDISLSYASGYARLTERQTLAASFKYFSLGEVRFADAQGNEYLQYRAFEAAVDAAYILKLSERMALATTFRYIYSGIGAGDYLSGTAFPGRAIAFDIGWYNSLPIAPDLMAADLAFGIHLSNLGTRMQYGINEHFLPMNLRLGTTYTRHGDEKGKFSLSLDLNKLLVPTEPERDANGGIISGKDPDRSIFGAVFGSLTDAPGGFVEEMSEIRLSTGLEWAPSDRFALRCGYYHTSARKDDLRYFTTGIGLGYRKLTVDFAYLLSTQRHNPLRNTLRFGLGYGW